MKPFLFAIFFSVTLLAEIVWPLLDRPVIDQVGWLTSYDKTEIEQLIRQTYEQGKGQLQVLIVPSLQGMSVESYSIQLMEKWKIGDKKRDDGVLFLVAAKERKMRIEVGQGLEGLLTDLKSKRILENNVRPFFKSKSYSSGVFAGVREILNTINPQQIVAAQAPQVEFEWGFEHFFDTPLFSCLVFLVIIILIIVSDLRGRRRRNRNYSNSIYWSDNYSDYSSNSRHSSSSSDSWSGGGGGFSGGGASSDW